jgi:hypothetical protein
VIVSFFLTLFPVAGLGQQSPVSLGFVAGANVADQAGTDVFAPHDRFGFIGGSSLVFRFSDRWSVQLDGLYVQKGGRENNDKDPGDQDDELSLEYLEFPLLLKFSLGNGGTRPELFVGPSLAFELSCTLDAFPDGTSDPGDCAEQELQTRSIDVGITFGADVEIPLGSGNFVIDGRGVVGLSSFDDSEANLDFRNRILALMVGYRFSL